MWSHLADQRFMTLVCGWFSRTIAEQHPKCVQVVHGMAANPFKSGAGGLGLVWDAPCVPSSSSYPQLSAANVCRKLNDVYWREQAISFGSFAVEGCAM